MRFGKSTVLAIGAAVFLALAAGSADARMGSGGSFGSRGTKTFANPPTTKTAPTTAQPLQRTITQPGAGQTATGAPAANTGFFGRTGFAGGLLTGLLGAGLIGMLMGGGFFGGIGGLGSILGLLLQGALVFFVVRWLIGMWQRRSQPAYAGAGGPMNRDAAGNGNGPRATPGVGGLGGGAAPAGNFEVTGADLDHFEKQLGEIQAAYSREDLGALRGMLTPEMLQEISEELTSNVSRGVVNKVTGVKLLQGDVAEAWSEGRDQYATLAMRYALKDVTEDRVTGRVVEEGPGEVTELWTFRRGTGGRWLLSAIQQA